MVPEAVKLWRESWGAGGEDTEAKLDLLIFLSDNQERAELFRLVIV